MRSVSTTRHEQFITLLEMFADFIIIVITMIIIIIIIITIIIVLMVWM
jgi:hypothetical protein